MAAMMVIRYSEYSVSRCSPVPPVIFAKDNNNNNYIYIYIVWINLIIWPCFSGLGNEIKVCDIAGESMSKPARTIDLTISTGGLLRNPLLTSTISNRTSRCSKLPVTVAAEVPVTDSAVLPNWFWRECHQRGQCLWWQISGFHSDGSVPHENAGVPQNLPVGGQNCKG